VFLPGAAAYDVRSESTVEMTTGPQAERGRERVTTTARVAYEITVPRAGAGSTGISGQVDALAMDASSRIGGTPAPGGAAPIRFHGSVDARGVHLDPDAPTLGCALAGAVMQAAALSAARETLLRVPPNVAVATRWRDSVSTITCRGPVTTTVTTVARYEVTAIDGPTVHVRRDVTVRLRGQAIAGGRSVTVTGSGAGTATLELDVALGRLRRVDGETRTTVTVALPDGAREFAQQVHTEVRAR